MSVLKWRTNTTVNEKNDNTFYLWNIVVNIWNFEQISSLIDGKLGEIIELNRINEQTFLGVENGLHSYYGICKYDESPIHSSTSKI